MEVKYKFYCTHNSIQTEVFPLNFTACKFSFEKESGQVFFRKKLQGKLVFIDDRVNSHLDWTYFKTIESGANRCMEISFLIKRSCDYGQNYTDYWEGYFAVNDGEFDLDTCNYSVDIRVDDDYRCLLENQNRELNIIDISNIITTSANIVADYEFYVCRGAPGSCTLPNPNPGTTWLLFHTETLEGETVAIYYREIAVTSCIGGVVQVPSGGGWVLKTDNCSTTGLATYVRTPTTVYTNNPNPDVAPGNCTQNIAGCFETIPPRIKTLNVTKTASPSTPSIRGFGVIYYQAPLGTYNYVYEVDNNPGSTYAWSTSHGGVYIISGNGTNRIVVSVDSNLGTIIISCIETTICGVRPVVTKTVTLVGTTSSSIPAETLTLTGPDYVCKNQTSIKYSIHEFLGGQIDDTSLVIWSVTGGASITAGQNTREVTVTAGTANFIVSGLATVSAGVGDLYKSWSKTVVVGNAVRTPDVTGLITVCPNSTGIQYTVATRSGATYTWTAIGGTITAGQGTGTVTVTWGSAGAGYVSVQESVNCNNCQWINIADCGDDPDVCEIPYYWCPSGGATLVSYTRGRLLSDVLEFFRAQLCSSITQVTSDFFEINPIGNAPGYSTGINYVTGVGTKVRYVSVHQKGDVITPTSTSPAPKAMLSFKDLTKILSEMFNVYWYISGGKLRFEHISFFQYTIGFDLTSLYPTYISGNNRYAYDKTRLPKIEMFRWMEALSTDFIGAEIRYTTLCVNQDESQNLLERGATKVTTDINHIYNNPSDISKDGFVFMANLLSGTTYTVDQEVGLITGKLINNGHLSWANLHYNYHRHDRNFTSGLMNLAATNFLSVKRTKMQRDVKFPLCCSSFDPTLQSIVTELGTGLVDRAELGIKDNILKLDLLHS